MKTLNLFLKIITQPTNFTLDQMANEMVNIYAGAGIVVNLISTETLDITDPIIITLNDIDTGNCTSGNPSAEQQAISQFRNGAGATDIVVYACRSVTSTAGALNGCASYPQNRPMAVIASYSSLYTLAHEVGHVLGLSHVNNNDMLMTGNGTNNITNPPPDLSASEIAIMNISPFVH